MGLFDPKKKMIKKLDRYIKGIDELLYAIAWYKSAEEHRIRFYERERERSLEMADKINNGETTIANKVEAQQHLYNVKLAEKCLSAAKLKVAYLTGRRMEAKRLLSQLESYKQQLEMIPPEMNVSYEKLVKDMKDIEKLVGKEILFMDPKIIRTLDEIDKTREIKTEAEIETRDGIEAFDLTPEEYSSPEYKSAYETFHNNYKDSEKL